MSPAYQMADTSMVRNESDESLEETLSEFLETLRDGRARLGLTLEQREKEHEQKEEWLRMRRQAWVMACRRRQALEAAGTPADAPRQWLPEEQELEEHLKREWLRKRRTEHAQALKRRHSISEPPASASAAPLVDSRLLSSPSTREAYLEAIRAVRTHAARERRRLVLEASAKPYVAEVKYAGGAAYTSPGSVHFTGDEAVSPRGGTPGYEPAPATSAHSSEVSMPVVMASERCPPCKPVFLESSSFVILRSGRVRARTPFVVICV